MERLLEYLRQVFLASCLVFWTDDRHVWMNRQCANLEDLIMK